jgi:hypothetical protein
MPPLAEGHFGLIRPDTRVNSGNYCPDRGQNCRDHQTENSTRSIVPYAIPLTPGCGATRKEGTRESMLPELGEFAYFEDYAELSQRIRASERRPENRTESTRRANNRPCPALFPQLIRTRDEDQVRFDPEEEIGNESDAFPQG